MSNYQQSLFFPDRPPCQSTTDCATDCESPHLPDMPCSIEKCLVIEPGTIKDYGGLAHFHYRKTTTIFISKVFKITDTAPERFPNHPTIGIIIYSPPPANCQLRNIATNYAFKNKDRRKGLNRINDNFRIIARVVIEPRYRALGLAYKLVKKTMPLLNIPYIEALATMGSVNPFFEKAGMTKYESPPTETYIDTMTALNSAGIASKDLIDIEFVNSKIEALPPDIRLLLENKVQRFINTYGKRGRKLRPGLERTEFILTKLCSRPLYYLWHNPAFFSADCEAPHDTPDITIEQHQPRRNGYGGHDNGQGYDTAHNNQISEACRSEPDTASDPEPCL